MRKVIVSCNVEYSYAAYIPDDVDVENEGDVISAVDGQDPVYRTIQQETSNVVGEITAVMDDETGEMLSEL